MRRLPKLIGLLLLLAIVLLCCRCCTPRYNTRWTGKPAVTDTVKYPVPNDSQTIVFMCISGGGTRAMAMGYYAVDELMKVKYKPYLKGKDTLWSTLRDEIDLVSGVSGGSFVAAALGMYGPNNWPDFYTNGVRCNIEKAVLLRLLLPWNWPWLASPYYTRTDIASEFYNKHIFMDKTFGQLYNYPKVYVNSTLLAEGAHLVFDDPDFSYLNSDRSTYPIGSACAASSAFPGGFAPMTIKNYGDSTPSEKTMLLDPKYRYAEANAYHDVDQADFVKMYRFLHDTANQWIHMSDGGIAGNSGMERVLDEFKTNGCINKALNNPNLPLKRIIVVMVNANTQVPDSSCVKQAPPGILKVLLYTTSTAMDILDKKVSDLTQSKLDEVWKAAEESRGTDKAFSLLEKPYFIELNGRNITDTPLQKQYNKIPTSFYLNDGQLDVLHKTILNLMETNSDYTRLKGSIKKEYGR